MPGWIRRRLRRQAEPSSRTWRSPRLVPQLSTSAHPPTRAELEEIVSSPAATILLARDDEGLIIGSLTLVVSRTPTGSRAWIEDVVVDEAARGQGAGEALVAEATRLASESGARTVDLTSRPSREAANALYEKVGFRARETNVYRYDLS
jgi:ribosomal protein S18 acetylase RimI-like enzyme